MVAGGRLGGHVVQGHVDATGVFEGSRSEGNSVVMRFRAPEGAGRYLIDKGSVAIEGVSLTVVRPEGDAFEVWVIPHTLERTNLGSPEARRPGQPGVRRAREVRRAPPGGEI